MPMESRSIRLLVLGSLLCGGLACAYGEYAPNDPMGNNFTLTEAHKVYTDAVRWSKFDEASAFITPAERATYLAQMPDFDEGRFTDWTAGEWIFENQETRESATIEVTYRAYSMTNPVEFKVKERQSWSQNQENKVWHLKSEFSGLGGFTY
ncbi:MAG TPA: hypothetical protein EYQ66_09375 [Myxococcales bacterium]|nr:hypothetical protein [Myxococcales bacterium]